jgi:hypothetical protein
MNPAQDQLYPIIRRVRRPLIQVDAGTTAPVVVPAKPAEPPASEQPPKTETNTNAAPPASND